MTVVIGAIACLIFWIKDYLLLSAHPRRGRSPLLAGYAAVVMLTPPLVGAVLSHSTVAAVACHAVGTVVCALLVLVWCCEFFALTTLVPSPVRMATLANEPRHGHLLDCGGLGRRNDRCHCPQPLAAITVRPTGIQRRNRRPQPGGGPGSGAARGLTGAP